MYEHILVSNIMVIYLFQEHTQTQTDTLTHRLTHTETHLHLASLAAHKTLNIYKPMEINIERSPQH